MLVTAALTVAKQVVNYFKFSSRTKRIQKTYVCILVGSHTNELRLRKAVGLKYTGTAEIEDVDTRLVDVH